MAQSEAASLARKVEQLSTEQAEARAELDKTFFLNFGKRGELANRIKALQKEGNAQANALEQTLKAEAQALERAKKAQATADEQLKVAHVNLPWADPSRATSIDVIKFLTRLDKRRQKRSFVSRDEDELAAPLRLARDFAAPEDVPLSAFVPLDGARAAILAKLSWSADIAIAFVPPAYVRYKAPAAAPAGSPSSGELLHLSDTTPRLPQTKAPAPQSESWTAAGFLGTLGIPELLAAQLVEVGGPNELGALQSLARNPDLKQELRRRLTPGIDALIDRLSSAFVQLASGAAPTAEQLQTKFMQDGAGLMAYGDLSTFFGGLEAMVGAPQPRVREAMAAEHTEQPDSHLEFTTENFGVTTTSATEWAFVAEPRSRPHGAWPVEAKLVLARKPGGSKSARLGERIAIIAHERQKRRRTPMPIAELTWRVAERGVRLQEQGEPALTLEEAFGARLYTGPLFVKYNAVLRGLDSQLLYLRCAMVRLCCSAEDAASHAEAAEEAKAKRLAEEPSFDERKPTAADEAALREHTRDAFEGAARRVNKYTTTLHALNSAIVKLSKLTKASTVYRGIHDMVLPDQFWTPNKYGVRGGIESAFMSTTLKREEAIKYAASGRSAPLIFEIQQGMIDRGADISFLSQYPFEEEILFNPLTGLEVRGSRVEGTVLVVEVKLSVNLTSLTIEQVIGKRKKMLQDMVVGVEAEVRQALRTEGLATPYGTEMVLGEFRKDVQRNELGHPFEWYNNDERLAEALQKMLASRQQYGPGGQRRAAALDALTMEEARRCGFPSSRWWGGPPNELLLDMTERKREPCYVACRLWGVNEIDFKRMTAVMVYRVHLVFRPRKEALQFLPERGRRVNSEEEAWKELEKLEALPALGVLNGRPVFTSKQEFFRVSDAKSVYDGSDEVPIWFPPLPTDPEREGTIAVLTGQIEATDVQLDLNFEEFPFDAHELSVKLFLPKKHKDKMYELHCDPNMRVKSEGIKAKEEGGQGILEVKPDVKKSLFDWDILPNKTQLVRNENAKGEQSGITMCIGIRRINQQFVMKFLVHPGVIAALACASTFIPAVEIHDRLALTFTILLTLTSIKYTSSDSLPALPYSTALDVYHEACHYLVYGVIMHNVIFFLYAARCSGTCAAEPTTNAAAGTVDPTMAACVASADAPCAAAAAEVADVAATVASRWCGMCGYKIVVDYWILLDLDDVFMIVLMAYWIYWNFRWFASRSSRRETSQILGPPPMVANSRHRDNGRTRTTPYSCGAAAPAAAARNETGTISSSLSYLKSLFGYDDPEDDLPPPAPSREPSPAAGMSDHAAAGVVDLAPSGLGAVPLRRETSQILGPPPRMVEISRWWGVPPNELLSDMMERKREPCYVACRLWGVNEIDFKRMTAVMVYRVHLVFRPRKEALQFLPERGRRVNSEEEAWKELEKLEALPALGVLNGRPVFTSKQEFFRVSDAKSVYDGSDEVPIWFPPLPTDPEREGTIAVLTGQIEATDVQLDLNFEEFPFDAHELSVKLFLPKKHKDKMYELHCDPNMRVKSEGIKAKEEGGQGILEVKPDVKKSLFDWDILPNKTQLVRNENAKGEQSGITMCIGIRRINQQFVMKFLVHPGVIAALACASTFIPAVEIHDRLALTFTILLTLTSIKYTSSDSLPALPYSTALDVYHEACHYLVYGVIMHNVIFFLYAARCSGTCAAEPTTNAAAGTVDPTMAACVASADAPCAAAAAEVADVAATVASRWCGMCGYKIVVDYWILLDLDDVFMIVLMAYWIYWNFRWFASRSSRRETSQILGPPPMVAPPHMAVQLLGHFPSAASFPEAGATTHK